MTSMELDDFLWETARIKFSNDSIPYVAANNLTAIVDRPMNSSDIEAIMNATIKLCLEVALNTVRTIEPDYLVEELTSTLTSLKVK